MQRNEVTMCLKVLYCINIMNKPAFRIFSFYLMIGVISCLFTSCSKNNVECQTPPPSFFFRVMSDGSIYPSQSDTSSTLIISYLDGDQRKIISDLKEIDGFFDSSEIITRSWALHNPAFTLELNGQEFTKIRFDTYMNNAKCQGWASVSNVYENGQLLQKNENRFFVLGSK